MNNIIQGLGAAMLLASGAASLYLGSLLVAALLGTATLYWWVVVLGAAGSLLTAMGDAL